MQKQLRRNAFQQAVSLDQLDRAFLTTLYEAPPYTSGQGNLQRVASTLRKQVGAQE